MSDANDTRRPLKVEIDVQFEGYSGREHHADALLYPKGLLLRTRYLKPVGTLADFEIFVVEGEPPLKGRGPVVFSRWQEQGPRRPAGLGLRVDQWEDDSATRAAQWFDEPTDSNPLDPNRSDSSVDLPAMEPIATSSSRELPPRADSSARLAEIEASLGPLTNEMRRSRAREDLESLGSAVVEVDPPAAGPAAGQMVFSNPWTPEPVVPAAPVPTSSWEVNRTAIDRDSARLAAGAVEDPPFRAVWAQVDPQAAPDPEAPSPTATPAEPFRPVWAPPAGTDATPARSEAPSVYAPRSAAPESGSTDVLGSLDMGTAPAFRPTIGGVKVRADDVPVGPDGDVVWAPASSRGRFLPWIGLGLLVGALVAGGYWIYQTRFASQVLPIAKASPAPAPAAPAPAPVPVAPVPSSTPQAPAPEVVPPPAAAATSAAADLPRFKGVREIRVDREGGGLAVVIELDGRVQAKDFSHFRLDSPAREVIRLTGVERPYERGKVAIGDALLTSVRTGAQPGNALQIVLDLGRSTVRAEGPVIDGTRLILRLRG